MTARIAIVCNVIYTDTDMKEKSRISSSILLDMHTPTQCLTGGYVRVGEGLLLMLSEHLRVDG